MSHSKPSELKIRLKQGFYCMFTLLDLETGVNISVIVNDKLYVIPNPKMIKARGLDINILSLQILLCISQTIR